MVLIVPVLLISYYSWTEMIHLNPVREFVLDTFKCMYDVHLAIKVLNSSMIKTLQQRFDGN